MPRVTGRTTLLGEPQRLLLKAVTGSGKPAVDAFQRWRSLVPFDEIEYSALRVVPLLLALVKREGLEDPDLQRMKGIERHIWASNTLRFKQLFQALTAIRRTGAPFVLLKGAALLARMPEMTSLRTTADYDVLVDPAYMGALRPELEAAGFFMRGLSFDDWGSELQSSQTGIPLTMAGTAAAVDIHWRPLPHLRDPKLTERILNFVEEGALHQDKVPIPSLAHQLFISLARCEPWDKDECLTRILEAYFLLSKCGDAVDWSELERLIAHYRLEACASAFFEELAAATGIAIPAAVRRGLPPKSFMLQKEWKARGIAPSKRTELQHWLLHHNDVLFSRRDAADWRLTLREAMLATINPQGLNLSAIWQSVSGRTFSQPDGRRKFLYGFSFPENWGRWTEGRLALAVIPLNDEQRNGAPVEIHGRVLNPGRRTRIFMAGGTGISKLRVPRGQTDVTLSLPLKSLDTLGGDGLLALWLPDAISPTELGMGRDHRALSFAFYRI
jgi:hypothetical protein